MGFAASQARLLVLTSRKDDLELQGQFFNQARMQLANTSGQLFQLSSNLEPESPQMQVLQARIANIAAIDKSLELQLRRVDTQQSAIQTEVDSVSKVLSKNLASGFKTFSDLG